MIQIIALGLLAIFTMYYIYFVTRVRIGLFSLRKVRVKNDFPIITIIIAARNEEKFIGQCLQMLVQQTYPNEKYEIIVVDDGSTDKTSSIVESFSKRMINIRLISLPTEGRQESSSKSLAITKGIELAKGEIILTTDADCLVPYRWVEIMASHFDDDVSVVAGPVIEQVSSSFFSRLEQLEFLGIITTAAGLIGSGRPIICNGANLAYRKSAFYAVEGFGDDRNSNDDETLMNRIVYKKVGEVVFAPEEDAVVSTNSSNTALSFIRQRVRWANKRGHYKDKSIFIMLLSLYMFFFSMAFTFILIPLNPQLILPLAFAFGGKVLVDYFTLLSGARLFKQRVSSFYFLVAELLHVPYILIAAAIGQFASIQWKGRKISQ
jgi:cellulose synthase/poly-beta-1,6-N-acetylglucosamine synthase-like glycosyltransferase